MPSESPKERNGRKYRSRKQRPCDLCRSRKTHCKIQESEAACELCKKLKRSCTFVMEPSRRTHNPRTRTRRLSPLPGEAQDVSTINQMPQNGIGDETRGAMDEAQFWLQRADRDSSFNLPAAMPFSPMDWSAVGFPSLGYSPRSHPNGLQLTV